MRVAGRGRVRSGCRWRSDIGRSGTVRMWTATHTQHSAGLPTGGRSCDLMHAVFTLRGPRGPVSRAEKHFLRMWLRCRALHGRRLLATTRERGHLCASAPRDPGAGCTDAAGCPEPHLRSARLPLADHLASNGSSRLVRSPGTHLALTEPSRSFARAHATPTMTPHVHQPYGRFSNGNELCV